MFRDRPSAEVIQLAIEQFGSEAHFADALGVPRPQLDRWKTGKDDPPPEVLQAIADLLRKKS